MELTVSAASLRCAGRVPAWLGHRQSGLVLAGRSLAPLGRSTQVKARHGFSISTAIARIAGASLVLAGRRCAWHRETRFSNSFSGRARLRPAALDCARQCVSRPVCSRQGSSFNAHAARRDMSRLRTTPPGRARLSMAAPVMEALGSARPGLASQGTLNCAPLGVALQGWTPPGLATRGSNDQ